jgi:hypothetical protein
MNTKQRNSKTLMVLFSLLFGVNNLEAMDSHQTFSLKKELKKKKKHEEHIYTKISNNINRELFNKLGCNAETLEHIKYVLFVNKINREDPKYVLFVNKINREDPKLTEDPNQLTEDPNQLTLQEIKELLQNNTVFINPEVILYQTKNKNKNENIDEKTLKDINLYIFLNSLIDKYKNAYEYGKTKKEIVDNIYNFFQALLQEDKLKFDNEYLNPLMDYFYDNVRENIKREIKDYETASKISKETISQVENDLQADFDNFEKKKLLKELQDNQQERIIDFLNIFQGKNEQLEKNETSCQKLIEILKSDIKKNDTFKSGLSENFKKNGEFLCKFINFLKEDHSKFKSFILDNIKNELNNYIKNDTDKVHTRIKESILEFIEYNKHNMYNKRKAERESDSSNNEAEREESDSSNNEAEREESDSSNNEEKLYEHLTNIIQSTKSDAKTNKQKDDEKNNIKDSKDKNTNTKETPVEEKDKNKETTTETTKNNQETPTNNQENKPFIKKHLMTIGVVTGLAATIGGVLYILNNEDKVTAAA